MKKGQFSRMWVISVVPSYLIPNFTFLFNQRIDQKLNRWCTSNHTRARMVLQQFELFEHGLEETLIGRATFNPNLIPRDTIVSHAFL